VADPAVRRRLTRQPIDAAAALAAVASRSAGASVLFLGTVRDAQAGRAVTGIDYSAYEAMAERAIARIESELETATPGLRVAIVHRLGALAVGEASVAIAASSPRRAAAQEAARVALERVKREVAIWKRERYADGTTAWREEEPLPTGRSAAR
jgi:molybdopterin synthase catalytic subunit